MNATTSSIDKGEVDRFAALADSWWNPDGPFRPLHKLSPVRIGFLRRRLVEHFKLSPDSLKPLTGMSLIDIGCGGGLVSEPMARLGATVTGVDAAAEGIEAAKRHAANVGLAIDYRATTAEEILAEGKRFDIVLALEVIEHVADPAAFVATCASLAKPGGFVAFATLSRTPKSFALGIVAAEYLLRWVPAGTHSWKKFVKPSELAGALRQSGLILDALTGVGYDPVSGDFSEIADPSVNYLLTAHKPV
ncbi:bifunctional 2-polyprenyl-6-hydroxyphenol methylase/3-demethylubiquinol 3-O-methyltransferase UbiG [Lacibacterium aquatile]|uniref:Ubiquinone biosynthesis O-methyltransferase n=1 Tax=Lacibacterium aquatile TaxID=1168082 RepID=A0ABW5DX69_9PROT